jgi:hypothetical protein
MRVEEELLWAGEVHAVEEEAHADGIHAGEIHAEEKEQQARGRRKGVTLPCRPHKSVPHSRTGLNPTFSTKQQMGSAHP